MPETRQALLDLTPTAIAFLFGELPLLAGYLSWAKLPGFLVELGLSVITAQDVPHHVAKGDFRRGRLWDDEQPPGMCL